MNALREENANMNKRLEEVDQEDVCVCVYAKRGEGEGGTQLTMLGNKRHPCG